VRAEYILSDVTKSDENPHSGEFSEAFDEQEFVQCAATIAIAFLNPCESFPFQLVMK
jgi:hypothetical protein